MEEDDYDYDYDNELEEDIDDKLEKMFKGAQNEQNPIEVYKNIIDLEQSNDNGKKFRFKFKCNVKLAIIHVKNDDEKEFEKAVQNFAKLYKNVEDFDKKDIDGLKFELNKMDEKEKKIKLYQILRIHYKENQLINELLELDLIICNIVSEDKKYIEYEKILPSLIEDTEKYKNYKIIKEIKQKLTEIENQKVIEIENQKLIEIENQKLNEEYFEREEENNENDYTEVYQYETEEIQKDIYEDSYGNIEFLDRIENLFEFNNKYSLTDIISNKMNYNNNYHINSSFLDILIVTQNIDIANKIVKILSNNKYEIHNAKLKNKRYQYLSFKGKFMGIKSNFKILSINDHLYETLLYENKNENENRDIYSLPTIKKIISKKAEHYERRIKYLSKEIDILLLWMENNSEGENISFEVIYNSLPFIFKRRYPQIYKINNPSLNENNIKNAFNENNLRYPNKFLSASVDCKQVIDLKIGLIIKKLLTEEYQDIILDSDQMPLLWLCLEKNENSIQEKKDNYFFEYELYVNMEKNNIIKNGSIDKLIENKLLDEKTENLKRKIKPTLLGINLIKKLKEVKPELANPEIKRKVEMVLKLLADGKENYEKTLNQIFNLYKLR